MRALAVLFGAVLAAPLASASVPAGEPPSFLDAAGGKAAADWVAAENARTLGVLQRDARYAGFHAAALSLAQSSDRIATPQLIGGMVYNFWQDPAHVRGIWRRTTIASYRTDEPDWTTVLDLDALAAREHANWVWKGADCAAPRFRRCLISLSDGGEDATTVREFDLVTRGFVPGGFVSPHSKQDVDWDGENAVLVARDWGPGTMTVSGYAFVLKRLERGQRLADAREVFRGNARDVEIDGGTSVDGDGHRATVLMEDHDGLHRRYLLERAGGTVALDLPPRVTLIGFVGNRLVFKIDEDWQARNGTRVLSGSLVSLASDRPQAGPLVICAPGTGDSIDDAAVTKNAVVVSLYHDVRGQGWVFTPGADGWHGRQLALPDNASVGIETASMGSEAAFFSAMGFLLPTQLWEIADADGKAAKIKALPAKFDASGMVVEQDWAVSSDGTRIPYFLVHAKGMKRDGHNPTELYAYGGFMISMTPRYDPTLGQLWLSHGGVYALANIRGGAEFGPSWHDTAVKTDRQRAYDDFTSVARDLIARKVTDARHLGIRGGSNGGLLMGVEFTQHPELWHAVMIDVPLLDMMNFETMAAGASWVGEYGSVSDPAVRAFWAKTSPLQNLKAGVDYPEPFIFTTTKDDRVGPVHARRFAWRMAALKLPFLYYEETEGGHAAGANLKEIATERALEYTYLARELMR